MPHRIGDITGPFGQAWTLPKVPRTPDHEACLGHWLLNVPGAHPYWEHWYIGLVHLRDLPNVPPAKKNYPEAEFEFFIASIDPEKCPEPDPDSSGSFALLRPLDVVEQFHGVSDRDAIRIAEAGLAAAVQGRISPDQDFRTMWHHLIDGTVKHFRAGGHIEN